MNPSETTQLSRLSNDSPSPQLQVVADVIQLGLLAVLLRWFFFENSEIVVAWQVLVTGGLLVAIWRSMGWVVLMATQLNLFVGEPRRFDAHQAPEAVLTCFVILVLLAYTCSFRTTRREVQQWFAKIISPLIGPVVGSTIGLIVRLLNIFAVVLVSVVLFGLLPLSAHAREQWWQLSLTNGLTLWPGPTALVFVLACVIVFSQIEWLQLRPAEARLYLRSLFVRYHYADLRMIVLRQMKAAAVKPVANELAGPNRSTAVAAVKNTPAS